MFSFALPLALLGSATLVLSFPSSPVFPRDGPSLSHAPNFKLTAHVTGTDLNPSIEGWVLSGSHIMPCYSWVILEDPTNSPGRIFYENGTAEEIRYNAGAVLSDGGSPPWPWSFIVPDEENEDHGRGVQVNCGAPTKGVYLPQFPDQDPVLRYGGGRFYACDADILYGPRVTLFYRDAEAETPSGCAEIDLVPHCVMDGAQHNFTVPAPCFA
ncbi:hypothetical protein BDY21DRAFT_178446 [Lineolata rhizophorae]|uniref:DUF7907 domain-containing protein n=1 Tax=Lineolata rhizophorae TaxID=578093 RepID=A0A6A6P775_9PEZI|nr:hypothetical protein BDY21DRAFT_178446 [Lineolata rhizophorae]